MDSSAKMLRNCGIQSLKELDTGITLNSRTTIISREGGIDVLGEFAEEWRHLCDEVSADPSTGLNGSRVIFVPLNQMRLCL